MQYELVAKAKGYYKNMKLRMWLYGLVLHTEFFQPLMLESEGVFVTYDRIHTEQQGKLVTS
jgi:hypothetical protein